MSALEIEDDIIREGAGRVKGLIPKIFTNISQTTNSKIVAIRGRIKLPSLEMKNLLNLDMELIFY